MGEWHEFSSTPAAKEIFSDACELPPDQRQALLDLRCGSDAPFRKAVEELLAAHDAAGRFLADPGASAARLGARTAGPSGAESVESRPRQIGPYKLLQLIGEGGFGVVYMAEQEHPLRRRVALKVIKAGMDTNQVIARFEAERQALAMMDHPNIAKVFDAGAAENGRPYFVMELVRGVPITEYCDANHLSTDERLELFVRVCLAVQHAHQKGVIHRDIKPSNVLVTLHDNEPVPKVIDFGIAKATNQRLTERTVFTALRQLVGTPQYMSPEQAETSGLDVDTRADIYSLGVLLYELLTGTTPLDAGFLREAPYAEIQRMIREVDPPKPSTRLVTLGETRQTVAERRQTDPKRLSQLLRGELDWIVMKCLEKDRTRRYETASGLAMDVRRYLDDAPVLARPAGGAYRLGKFVRRHKAAAAAVAAVALALTLGIIGTTAGMVRARAAMNRAGAAERNAIDERNAARAAQIQAEQSAARARREAERATAVGDFMRRIFALAHPGAGGGGQARVVDLLRLAGNEIDYKLKDQPEEAALAHATLAETYQRLGMHDLAAEQFQLAHGQSRALAGGEHSEQTLKLQSDLALALASAGDGARAEPLARDALTRLVAALGNEHPLAWRAANALAVSLAVNGKLKDSRSILSDLVQRLGDIPRARTVEHLGQYHHNLAICLRELGLYKDAMQSHHRAGEILRGDPAADPTARMALMHETSVTLAASGDYRGAVTTARQLLGEQRKRLGDSHPASLAATAWLSTLEMSGAQFDEAKPLLEQYISAALSAYPQGTDTVSNRMIDLARLKLRENDKTEADRLFAEAIAMRRRLVGRDDWRNQNRWRDWVLGCSSLPEGWRSAAWRDQVWCALDDLLRDNPAAVMLREQVDLERARFKLIDWSGAGGGGPAAAAAAAGALDPGSGQSRGKLLADGGLGQLKALPEPTSGLYLLGMEVPRRNAQPLRRAAWLVIAQWELKFYALPKQDFQPEGWPAVIAGEPILRRTSNALALNDILAFACNAVDQVEYFGVVATTSLELPAGRYRFSISSDDGARLLVDGRPVAEHRGPHLIGTIDGEAQLEAGRHQLRVEFHQLSSGFSLWVQAAPLRKEALSQSAALGGGIPGLDNKIYLLAQGEADHPDQAHYVPDRAMALACAGRFMLAEAELARALEMDASQHVLWHTRTALAAYRADQDRYREVCSAMLSRFGQSTDYILAERSVRACTILPGPVPPELARLLEVSMAGAPEGYRSWPLLAKGMLDYRAGRYQDAVDALERSLRTMPEAAPGARATAELFTAMARHRLGRTTDARKDLDRAVMLIRERLPVATVQDLGPGGVDNWLTAHTAHREAAALMGLPAPADASPGDKPPDK